MSSLFLFFSLRQVLRDLSASAYEVVGLKACLALFVLWVRISYHQTSYLLTYCVIEAGLELLIFLCPPSSAGIIVCATLPA